MRTRTFLALAGAALALITATAPAAGAADTVYWSNYLGYDISGANLDGSGGGFDLTEAETGNGPNGIAIDAAADRIYWADYSGSGIWTARLDGSEPTELDTGEATVDFPSGVALDREGGRIYWANYGGGLGETIGTTTDGSGDGFDLDLGAAPIRGPVALALDPVAERIFWSNVNATPIAAVNVDGSEGSALATTGATAIAVLGIALDTDGGKIYWSNSIEEGGISGANLDGSGEGFDLDLGEANAERPRGIALDPEAGKVYWVGGAGATEAVSFANLDGSGGGVLDTEPLTIGSKYLSNAALLKAPAPLDPPLIENAAPGSAAQPLSCAGASWKPDLPGALLARAPRSVSYRWSRDGEPIAGAEAASYTATQAGSYSCEAVAENRAGTTAQASAALAVAISPAAAPLTPAAGSTGAAPLAPAAVSPRLWGPKRQRLGQLKLKLGCGAAPCRLRLRGVATVPLRAPRAVRRLALRPRVVSLAAGQRRTVRLRPRKPRAATALLRRAGARVDWRRARVRVTAVAIGKGKSRGRTVKLARPRR